MRGVVGDCHHRQPFDRLLQAELDAGAAVHLRQQLLVLAFEFDVEVYDYGWQLLSDDRAVLEREAPTLEAVGAECNRFLLGAAN